MGVVQVGVDVIHERVGVCWLKSDGRMLGTERRVVPPRRVVIATEQHLQPPGTIGVGRGEDVDGFVDPLATLGRRGLVQRSAGLDPVQRGGDVQQTASQFQKAGFEDLVGRAGRLSEHGLWGGVGMAGGVDDDGGAEFNRSSIEVGLKNCGAIVGVRRTGT